MWEAMLLASEFDDLPVDINARPRARVERPEEPDMQDYLARQLEREGYDARGVRLENLPE